MLLPPKLENIASLKDDPEERSHRTHHAHTEWLKHRGLFQFIPVVLRGTLV